MNGYKVVSNVERPKSRGLAYPFAEMKEGDSFGIDVKDMRRVSSAAWQYGRRYKMKFSVRQSGKEGRCWRIK